MTLPNQMDISFDVTDWLQKYKESPARPENFDEAISLMLESDVKPSEIALLLLVGRELGIVKEPHLPTNKLNTMMGGALALMRYRTQVRQAVKINGKSVDVPAYVSTVTTQEGEPAQSGHRQYNSEQYSALDTPVTTVRYDTPEAVQNAIDYLRRNVMGRIHNRFSIIAASAPHKLPAVANDLKNAIDALVADMVKVK